MEESMKQRLMRFIKSEKISQGKFERMCGMSNGYLCNIKQSIGSSKILSISKAFPQLNTEWLLTGEGSMLNEGYTTFDPVGLATPMSPTAMTETEKEVVLLQAKLEEKEKMITILEDQLKKLNDMHRDLLATFTNVVTANAKKVVEK